MGTTDQRLTVPDEAVGWSQHFGRHALPHTEVVGAKAFELMRLPLAWVPPFAVLTTWACIAWRSLSGDARLTYLVDLFNGAEMLRFLADQRQLNRSMLVRSSAPKELLSRRGLLVSREAPPDPEQMAAIANSLWEINLNRLGNSDDLLALIIQPHVASLGQGHLSNERRVSRRARSWLCEDTSKEPVNALRIARSRPYDDERELGCHDQRTLLDRLRDVASRRDAIGVRRHYEWIWDSRRLWIVQADKDLVGKGIAPNAAWFSRPIAPPPNDLRYFIPESSSTGTYRKTESCAVFRAAGAPTPRLFVLEDRAILAQLISGNIPSDLRADLAVLLASPIVIRTDVSQRLSADAATLLPRSDTLIDLDGAAAFLTRAARVMSEAGNPLETFCFIAHRFIPARAGAWSLADPAYQQVVIDATWGFPDGLLAYPHDTYQVYPADPRQDWHQVRCKSQFVDGDALGRWNEHEAGWPWDWQPSLTTNQQHEIGQISLAIARQRGGPCATMFFVGVSPTTGYPDCLPWISVPHEHIASAHSAPAHFAGISRLIREERDLQLISQDIKDGLVSGRVVLRLLPVEQLIRDVSFLQKVAQTAKQLNAPVYLEGSILTHTYYILRRDGVQVMTPPLDKMPPEPRQSYSKLVRSGIPAAVEKHGESSRFHRASPGELILYLKRKAEEEASELGDASTPTAIVEEAADLLEVLKALADALGVSFQRFEEKAEQKRAERGGFQEGIVLESTSTNSLLARLTSANEYLVNLPPVGGASIRPAGERRRNGNSGRRIVVQLPIDASHRESIDLVVSRLPRVEYDVRTQQRGVDLLIELSPLSSPAAGEQLKLFERDGEG